MPLTFTRRPVSPVRFESAPVSPEDVLYPGSDEDEELDIKEQRKREKRIEELARGYLGGRGLFIQSALLKGPFEGAEGGWKNPWARKRKSLAWVQREKAKRGSNVEEGRRPRAKIGSGTDVEEPMAKRRRRDGRADREDANFSMRESSDYNKKPINGMTNGKLARGETHRSNGFSVPAPRDQLHRDARDSRWTAGIRKSPRPRSEQNHVKNEPTRPISHLVDGSDALFEPEATRQRQRQGEQHRYTASSVKCKGGQIKKEDIRSSKDGTNLSDSSDEELFVRQLAPPTSPRKLEPYVSSFVEHATSGKLAAKHTNGSPRPSPRAVPLTSTLPEFRFRYARKNSASTSDRSNALFVDAPEALVKKERSGSRSPSCSSDSSAFAADLAAAQGDNGSAARACSPPSMPKVDPEIKRLSFTASGKPRLGASRPSSRSGPACIDPALLNRGNVEEKRSNPALISKESSKSSEKPPWISKSSSNLSGKPSTNGDHLRETLPEAQIVPDEAVPTAPSGPSTNLLETEKQSPRPLMIEDDDSYLKLSARAAALKAQVSFQNEFYTPLDDSKVQRPSTTIPHAIKDDDDLASNANLNQTRSRISAVRPHPPTPASVQTPTTQQMINVISPLTITTTAFKEAPPPSLKKRTSFAPSPTFSRRHPDERKQEEKEEPSSLPSPLSPGPPPPPAHSYHRDHSMSTSPSERGDREGLPAQPLQHKQRQYSSATKPPSSSELVSGRTSFSALPTVSTSFLGTQWGAQDGQVVPHAALMPPPSAPPSATAPVFPTPSFPEDSWIEDEDGGVELPLNPNLLIHSFTSPVDAKKTGNHNHPPPATDLTTKTSSQLQTPNHSAERSRVRRNWLSSPSQDQRNDSVQREVDAALDDVRHFLGGETLGWDGASDAKEGRRGGVRSRT